MLVVSLVKSSPFILVFGEIVDGKMRRKKKAEATPEICPLKPSTIGEP